MYAVPDQRGAEIDEQAQPKAAQFEVGLELLQMDGLEALDRLELDEHEAVDFEVNAEALVDPRAPKLERDRPLPYNVQGAAREFLRQQDLIDRLEQAGSELGVEAEGRIDDLPGNLILRHAGRVSVFKD